MLSIPQLRLQLAEISVQEITSRSCILPSTSRTPSLATSISSIYDHILYTPMSSPQPKSGVTRTRTGCWTCRARRKKCDEGRPFCQACRGLGLQCEGYGVRLKWAIRGRPCVTVRHLALRKTKQSTVEPKVESQGTPVAWPASVLGKGEKESNQVLLQYLGWSVYASLSKFERDVLYDCTRLHTLYVYTRLIHEQLPTGVL